MSKTRDVINKLGYYCATVHGCSMNPLLYNHRDSVYIEKTDSYKKYDVVLFEREDGQLVLHRIVGFDGDTFIIVGDNDFICERVSKSQLIGKMTEFSRKGREHTTTEPWYVIYSRVWCFSLATKRVLKFIYRSIVFVKNHLKRKSDN